jgi:WD40 repeat protein
VVAKRGGVTIVDTTTSRRYTLKPGKSDVDAGKYRIEVAEDDGDLRLFADEFTISRGGRALVRVRLDTANTATAKKEPEKVGEVRCFWGHTREVYCAKFTPDGRRVVTASFDGIIYLWDARSGKLLHSFTGHDNLISGLDVSRDGSRAVTASHDGTIRVWDLVDLRQCGPAMGDPLPGHSPNRIALAPDGRHALLASFSPTLVLLDLANRRVVRRFEGHKGKVVNNVAISANGTRAVSGGEDHTVRVWDMATGKHLHCFEGHTGNVHAVAYAPDGRHVLSGGWDDTVRLWEVETGKEVRRFSGRGGNAVAFSPDGKRILIGGDGTVSHWDVASGREITCFRHENHRKGWVGAVAFSPDGHYGLSGGNDGTARLWRLPEPSEEKLGEVRELSWPGGKQNVFYAAFSPDGRHFLAGSDLWSSTTAVWETATGRLVTTLDAAAGAVFLPDNRHVLGWGRDNQLVVWDPIADKEVRRFQPNRSSAWPSLSADGTRALSYGSELMVLWDVATGKPIAELQAGHDGLFLARLSPDGKRIASVGVKDRTVRLWDVAKKKVIRSWHSKDRAGNGLIHFHPNSRSFVIATDAGSGIVRFDEQADCPTWLPDLPYDGASGISDNGRFALLSNGKTTVRGYDLGNGREMGRVVLPTDIGGYIAVSADGRCGVATGPRTGTIKGAVRIYLFRLP